MDYQGSPPALLCNTSFSCSYFGNPGGDSPILPCNSRAMGAWRASQHGGHLTEGFFTAEVERYRALRGTHLGVTLLVNGRTFLSFQPRSSESISRSLRAARFLAALCGSSFFSPVTLWGKGCKGGCSILSLCFAFCKEAFVFSSSCLSQFS